MWDRWTYSKFNILQNVLGMVWPSKSRMKMCVLLDSFQNAKTLGAFSSHNGIGSKWEASTMSGLFQCDVSWVSDGLGKCRSGLIGVIWVDNTYVCRRGICLSHSMAWLPKVSGLRLSPQNPKHHRRKMTHFIAWVKLTTRIKFKPLTSMSTTQLKDPVLLF
jgi:hypothetical protein